MLKHFQSQENRREWYMVVGLIFGTLTLTHWLWGWPVGISTTVQAIPQVGDGVLSQIPWRHLLEGLPLLAVGILYYLGRRYGNRTPTHFDDSDMTDAVRGMLESRAQTINTQGQELRDLQAKYAQATQANAQRLEELGRMPTLTIHSAIYGAGHIGGEDLPVEPHRLQARNALAIQVRNNALVVRDPAEGKKKRVLVRYSFANTEVREANFWEGTIMVLPEPQVRSTEEREWLQRAEKKLAQIDVDRRREQLEVADGLWSLVTDYLKMLRAWPTQVSVQEPFIIQWRPPVGETQYGRDVEAVMRWLESTQKWIAKAETRLPGVEELDLVKAFSSHSYIRDTPCGALPLLLMAINHMRAIMQRDDQTKALSGSQSQKSTTHAD